MWPGTGPWCAGAMAQGQTFELVVEGRRHRVETSVGDGWSHHATWWVDDEEIATKKTASEDNIYLAADKEHELSDVVGAVRVRFTTLGKPVRATWFEGTRDKATAASWVGTGGIDLVPEPGSPAAVREEKMRANPLLYSARHVAGGVGAVLVPIIGAVVVAWVLARVSWPDWDIPWPDLDLPSIPWPEIPWPSFRVDIDWEAPSWLRWILDKVTFVWPVLLGIWLARREMRRRREQDALRARMSPQHPSAHAAGESPVRDVPPGEAEDADPGERQATDPGDHRAGDVDVLGGDVADETEGRPLDEPPGEVEAGPHVGEDRAHGEERPHGRLDPR